MSPFNRIRLPQFRLFTNLSIRTKITVGFAVVLVLSAVSVVVAYLGYDKVSAGFTAYRTSVSEGGMARTIDREVSAYQLAARYYIVTGDETDATNALAAEGDLRDAIDKAARDMKDASRRNAITGLSQKFEKFTKVFSQVLDLKRDNFKHAANELQRGGSMLRQRLEDLADTATLADLSSLQTGAKEAGTQFVAAAANVNMFVTRPRQPDRERRRQPAEDDRDDADVAAYRRRGDQEEDHRDHRPAHGVPQGVCSDRRQREEDRRPCHGNVVTGRCDRQGCGDHQDQLDR